MLVAVDAMSWANRRGYGRFTRNVVAALVDLDEQSRYVLVCDEATAGRADLPPGAETEVVRARRPAVEAAAADSGRPPADLLRMSRAVSRLAPDVVLFPSVYTWFPVLRTPTVVGVHDLIADEHPELTLPSRAARLRWRLKRGAATRSATRIFTVSEASRAVVAATLGVASDEIAVVPEAPEALFGPRDASETAPRLAPLGLAPQGYVLYVGGISPHKGLETLLEAYAGVVARTVDAPRLVLAGALEDESYLSSAASVRRDIAERGLTEQVLLPGHVADDVLACLYAGALAFVSPSRSEGFGLPAVEAAVSGAPAVLSDIPAYRESLGDAARFFPVDDAGALAEVLGRVIGDDGLRAEMAARARERVAGLSWRRAAEVLRGVLGEAARG